MIKKHCEKGQTILISCLCLGESSQFPLQAPVSVLTELGDHPRFKRTRKKENPRLATPAIV